MDGDAPFDAESLVVGEKRRDEKKCRRCYVNEASQSMVCIFSSLANKGFRAREERSKKGKTSMPAAVVTIEQNVGTVAGAALLVAKKPRDRQRNVFKRREKNRTILDRFSGTTARQKETG